MMISRRNALVGGISAASFGAATLKADIAFAQRLVTDALSRENVLNDPAIPLKPSRQSDARSPRRSLQASVPDVPVVKPPLAGIKDIG